MVVFLKKYVFEGIMYLRFGFKGGIIVFFLEMVKEIFKNYDFVFV